jgi:hypothetical protein
MSKTVFIQGPPFGVYYWNLSYKHQSKQTIVAHNISLGQVRADEIDGNKAPP